MNFIFRIINSSIGKKYVLAMTGLSLVGFVVFHLLGNLTLYFGDGVLFNEYVRRLYSMGSFLIVLEIGLFLVFIIHIFFAIWFSVLNKISSGNKSVKTKMGYSSIFSRNMILSGLFLLLFLIIHVIQFRFGPDESEGYVAIISGEESRDLYKLVVETFKNGFWTTFYVISMMFLSFHLFHGFWSSFQSMGFVRRSNDKFLRFTSLILSIILFLGFSCIPIWIYFFVSEVD